MAAATESQIGSRKSNGPINYEGVDSQTIDRPGTFDEWRKTTRSSKNMQKISSHEMRIVGDKNLEFQERIHDPLSHRYSHL